MPRLDDYDDIERAVITGTGIPISPKPQCRNELATVTCGSFTPNVFVASFSKYLRESLDDLNNGELIHIEFISDLIRWIIMSERGQRI